jgi:shikimate dehydrogenase
MSVISQKAVGSQKAGDGPQCCVIGHPIAHSRSPLIHGHWLKQHGLAGAYGRIDVTPDALAGFIHEMRKGRFHGCNVTVPHKIAVMELVDQLTPAARAIGAVNTLYFAKGNLVGDNTDAAGFLGHLDASAPEWAARTATALLLGAGGAARSIAFGLASRGMSQILIANRDRLKAEALAAHIGVSAQATGWDTRHEAVGQADLIVNTTSLGMTGQPPLDIDMARMRPGSIVDDIVYSPLKTGLLLEAEKRGGIIIDGLGMLLHQAVAGFAHWFGVRPVVTPELRALIEADLTGPK